ncbi:unnamed protein product [Blepharisma stoltei]|uniref:Uncharacterized protein n=1 Tax=Blepharisma stoltei TaxID=1481888 RepID=A0AAU9KGJ1_9CILI|nr:unnamed protein product [Blepharisma stoltei]
MLELLCDNLEIHEFLGQFPKHQWRKCVEASVVIGIKRLKENYPIITYEKLLQEAGFQDNKKRGIEQALNHMKNDIERISSVVGHLENRPKPNEKHAIQILQQNSEEMQWKPKQNLKPTKRDINYVSPSRSSSRSKQNLSGVRQNSPTLSSSKLSHQHSTEIQTKKNPKLPRYLSSVQSKIKGEIQKDVALYNCKGEIESQTERQTLSRENSTKNLREVNLGYPPKPPIYQNRSGSLTSLSFTQDLKEPDTCPIEQLPNYIKNINHIRIEPKKQKKECSEENEMIRIADDFLKNPYTSFLTKEPSTMPTSPMGFNSNLSSPSNRFGQQNKETMQYRY